MDTLNGYTDAPQKEGVMSAKTKTFHIGTILTITSGKMISPNHIDGVYAICDWMTGEANFTHQLPRVSREIEPALRSQFPELAAIEVPSGLNSKEAVLAYLQSLESEYGTEREVARMDDVDHTTIHPIAEIKMLNPNAKIIEI